MHGARVVGVAASPAQLGYRVVELDTGTGPRARSSAPPTTDPVDPAYYPEQIRTFTGPTGRDVHAHIYPPHNDRVAPDDGRLPPYRHVWAHGGPTGHALVLDLEIAYFTSRGIGVAGSATAAPPATRPGVPRGCREQWASSGVEDSRRRRARPRRRGTAGDRLAVARRRRRRLDQRRLPRATTGVYACGTIKLPDPWSGPHRLEPRRDPRLRVTLPGDARRPARRVPARYRGPLARPAPTGSRFPAPPGPPTT
ncbi:hypothetical protein [Streptomyces sp. KL116D]|uniref:hypothetical protein n=1 Tax=Streptomyces sp. KL116D TaxID=3045152 RepID=UPI003558AFA2